MKGYFDMIYIVEDDNDIRELEVYALKNSGYDVKGFEDAASFYNECAKELPELLILDIMLPNESGLNILARLKSDPLMKNIPIIFVTAKSSELDVVKGLDMGADDYITKPFGVMELISRVRAVLRRNTGDITNKSLLKYANIILDDSKRQVFVEGENIELTYKEFELLKLLMLNHDIVLSREKLLEEVWGFTFEVETRTLDMHIRTLRKKLKSAGSLIKTVRNVGYKVSEQ